MANTSILNAIKTTYQSVINLLSNKADKATSLSGYGITNAYTKTEIDDKIGDV